MHGPSGLRFSGCLPRSPENLRPFGVIAAFSQSTSSISRSLLTLYPLPSKKSRSLLSVGKRR